MTFVFTAWIPFVMQKKKNYQSAIFFFFFYICEWNLSYKIAGIDLEFGGGGGFNLWYLLVSLSNTICFHKECLKFIFDDILCIKTGVEKSACLSDFTICVILELYKGKFITIFVFTVFNDRKYLRNSICYIETLHTYWFWWHRLNKSH